jgi:hypothetical protein
MIRYKIKQCFFPDVYKERDVLCYHIIAVNVLKRVLLPLPYGRLNIDRSLIPRKVRQKISGMAQGQCIPFPGREVFQKLKGGHLCLHAHLEQTIGKLFQPLLKEIPGKGRKMTRAFYRSFWFCLCLHVKSILINTFLLKNG